MPAPQTAAAPSHTKKVESLTKRAMFFLAVYEYRSIILEIALNSDGKYYTSILSAFSKELYCVFSNLVAYSRV